MEGTSTLATSPPATVQITAAAAAAAATGDRSRGNSASPAPSASLHSVRKPQPAKPWKKPASVPIPPKVYRVDPRGFRQLVQSLTGAATEPAPRRLQDASPAPLALASRLSFPPPQQQPPPPPPMQAYLQVGAPLYSTYSMRESALGFSAGEAAAVMAMAEPPQMDANVHGSQYSQFYPADIPSPSLYSACLTWCNTPLLSPRSMACLEQSTVL